MTEKFPIFAKAVRDRFDDMATDRGSLFVVNTDREFIWATYLDAFPAGTDPIFRKRREHDCSCCRAFIRNVGNVVAIQNGAIATVWDLNGLPEPYQAIADAMAKYIRLHAIVDIYLVKQAQQGTPLSRELTADNGSLSWHHFAVTAPSNLVDSRRLDERRGEARTTFDVLKRGVMELKSSALASVLDLIDENGLYRGAEHRPAVAAFATLQSRINEAPLDQRDVLIWQHVSAPVARFRNAVIGTLVQDISDDVDIERAVKAFETKVAPQNYKRPTAVITKSMVTDAMKTIEELGLESALERRHARLSDVSVASVLFVDNAVVGQMRGGIEAKLMEEVRPAPFVPTKADEISVDDFIANVLPKAKGLKLYLDNVHSGNFVSMTAPVHADSKSLFKWSNDFAWSYDGNVTDSIKERVKRAGGKVEGVDLRVSLAWSNHDDLDLHCIDPVHGHIYFGSKHGILDVDMNAGSGVTREPVENMRWAKLRDGIYRFHVNQYARREARDVGFVVEIEAAGLPAIETLRYERAVSGNVTVADVTVVNGRVLSIRLGKDMIAGSISQEKWGVKTLDLVRVNSLVLSPNHWDDNAVGNKHWLFILDGCNNPAPTRGIYNEFLSSKLEKHRKVFEILGDKTKCPPSAEQLSGVGFSAGRNDKVTVLATGPKLSKAYTLVF